MNDYKLEHISSYTGLLAHPPEVIGPVPEGIRVNFYSAGGEITGARVRGTLRPNDLPREMEDVRQFTNCVLRPSGDEDTFRGTLRQRYGDRGLIELSYAIASSRIPPTVKRVLGYAKS
jgi:hypothetical protein